MSTDDNVPLAKAIQLAGSYPQRKVQITSSAHTGFICGVVLKPDGSWASQQQHVRDMVEQFGEPRVTLQGPQPLPSSVLTQPLPSSVLRVRLFDSQIWKLYSVDNLPTNAQELRNTMPTTQFTTDLKHYEARIKNTFRSYSSQCARLSNELASDFLAPLEQAVNETEPPVGSKQYIIKKLMTAGGIPAGEKVMIEKGQGKSKPKYFTFGAEHDGAAMDEQMVNRILGNGCFETTFKSNLRTVWRSVGEMRARLESRRDALTLVGAGVRDVYAQLRESARDVGESSSAPLALNN
jgi:hypothetical protein